MAHPVKILFITTLALSGCGGGGSALPTPAPVMASSAGAQSGSATTPATPIVTPSPTTVNLSVVIPTCAPNALIYVGTYVGQPNTLVIDPYCNNAVGDVFTATSSNPAVVVRQITIGAYSTYFTLSSAVSTNVTIIDITTSARIIVAR